MNVPIQQAFGGRIMRVGVLALAGVLLAASAAVATSRIFSDSELELTTSNDQQSILEDGIITFSEYESALNAAIDCARDSGVEVTEPAIGFDGVTLNYAVISSDSGDEAIDAFDSCYNDLAHSVDLSYQTSNEVDEARIAYRTSLLTCVSGSVDKAIDEAASLVDFRPADADAMVLLMENDKYEACAEDVRPTPVDATYSG